MLRCFVPLLGVALFITPLSALENLWQGGNGGAWETPSNWSLGVVPQSSHDAVIDGGSVALPGNPSAALLAIRSGTVTWTGGVAPFPVQISTGGVFELSGTTDKKIKGSITNSGTFRWAGTGNLLSGAAGDSIVNQATGLVELHSDALLVRDLDITESRCAVQNSGILRKVAGGAAAASVLRLDFESLFGGTVEVLAGNLELGGGISPSYTFAGTFQLSAGSDCRILDISHVQFGSSALFQGPGSLSLGRGGVSFESSKLLSGTYRGSAPLVWKGSRLEGEWTIAAGATCVIAGAGDREFAGTIHNAGTLRWTGSGNVQGVQAFFGATALDNLAGGLIDLQSDALLTRTDGFPQGVALNNAGILRKSAGQAGAASRLELAPSTNLGGTIELLQGNLEFPVGLTSDAATTLNSGTELRVTGFLQLGANATFDGLGSVCAGYLQPSFGDYLGLYGTYRGSAPLLWKSSHWSGNLTVGSGALLRVVTTGTHEFTAAIRVAGIMRIETATPVEGGGSFSGDSPRLEILSGGLVDLQADGSLAPSGMTFPSALEFINGGTLRKSAGQSTGASVLSFSYQTPVGGVIEVQQGNLEFPNGLHTSATVHLAAGTEFRLSGGSTLASQAIFQGPGVVCAGYRQPQFGDYVSFYGTYRGTAPLLWKSSFLGGEWTVGADATLVVATAGTHQLDCRLSVAGTLRWMSNSSVLGGQFFGEAARLEILPSGLFDLQSDALLARSAGFPAGMVLVNNGTIRKSGGQANGASALQLDFGSSLGGTIEIQQGNLEFPNGAEFSGPVNVASAAECRLTGGVTFGSTAVFQGPGLVRAGYQQPSFGDYLGLQGTYRGNALLVWRSSHVNGDWTVGTGATLVIETSGTHELGGTLRNAGTVRCTSSGPLYGGGFAGAARIENLASGLLDLQADAFLGRDPSSFPTGLVLTNAGILRKSAGLATAASVLQLDAGSVLGGTIELQQGHLEFANGGQFEGVTHIAAASECRLTSYATFGPAASFQGPGVVCAGYLQPPFGDYVGFGGIYRGSALLLWKSSHLSGDWTVGSGATFAVTTDGTHELAGTVRNAGTIRWETTGPIHGGFGAVLENQKGGLIDLQTDATLSRHPTNFPTAMLLTNAGTIRKSAGLPGGASVLSLDPGSASSGTISVLQGNLRFTSGCALQGLVSLAAGSQCVLQGAFELGAAATFDGPGTVRLRYLQVLPFGPSAALSGTYRGTAELVWESGSVDGLWTLAVGTQCRLVGSDERVLGGQLTCAGTLVWEGSGPLRAYSNSFGLTPTLSISAGGLLDLRSDAVLEPTTQPGTGVLALQNAGIIRKSAGGVAPAKSTFAPNSFTQTAGSRLEILAGTLSFPNGFAQSEGETRLEGSTLEAGTLQMPGTIQLLGGVLSGVGTLRGTVSNAATVRVGQGLSPGVLAVQGDFSSSGQIVARIGPASQVNDHLEISGAVQLGGNLQIELLGAAATSGTAFDVVVFTAGQGSTGTVTLQPPPLGSAQTLSQTTDAKALRVRVQNSLSAWRDAVFGPESDNPAIAGNQADPNHNGLRNLLEYAFGLDPLSPAFGPVLARLPRLSLATSPTDGQLHLTLSFQRRLGSDGQDLRYVVESAQSLFGPWDASGSPLESAGPPVPDADGITERVSVRVIAPLSASPIHFLRLRVTEL